MLKLENQKITQIASDKIEDELRILCTDLSDDYDYFIISEGKPYPLVIDGKYLVWFIPPQVNKNHIKLRLQAIDAETRAIAFFTNIIEITSVSTAKLSLPANTLTTFTTTTITELSTDYPVYDMADEHPVIPVNNRTIQPPTGYDIVVSQDNVSQLVTFEINRYFDGVDLSEKTCNIKYRNANGMTGRAMAVNVVVEETKIFLGWLLDNNVAAKAGVTLFSIEFIGYNEHGQFYVWQTKPAQLRVEEGLFVDDDVVVEAYPTVIQNILIRLKALEVGMGVVPGDSPFQIYESVSEFPPVGNIDTLYIVKGIGDEGIYGWDADYDLYFLVSNNFNNIGIMSGGGAI